MISPGWACVTTGNPGAVSTCAQTCGNGVIDAGEACDDINGTPVSGDGCSASCLVETGWSCDSSSPSVCTITCGDGIVV